MKFYKVEKYGEIINIIRLIGIAMIIGLIVMGLTRAYKEEQRILEMYERVMPQLEKVEELEALMGEGYEIVGKPLNVVLKDNEQIVQEYVNIELESNNERFLLALEMHYEEDITKVNLTSISEVEE